MAKQFIKTDKLFIRIDKIVSVTQSFRNPSVLEVVLVADGQKIPLNVWGKDAKQLRPAYFGNNRRALNPHDI